MRSDQNVGLTFVEVRYRRALLGGAAQATDDINCEWEVLKPLREGAEMLLREDRCRCQHQHLRAVTGGLEGGAQGNFGLAEADVSARPSLAKESATQSRAATRNLQRRPALRGGGVRRKG